VIVGWPIAFNYLLFLAIWQVLVWMVEKGRVDVHDPVNLVEALQGWKAIPVS